MLRHVVSHTSRRCAAVGIIILAATSDSLDENNSSLTRAPISFTPILRQLFFHPTDFALQGFASSFLFSSPVGVSFSFGIGSVSPDNSKKEESRGDEVEVRCGPGCLGRDAIANAAATAGPSVVNISVSRGIHGLTLGKSKGSGTIIDSDGTILTCAHVVVDFEGMKSISKGKVDVTLQDGREFQGDVVSADIHSDIAVVKIKSKTPLPSAKIGSSRKLRPGDWVLAMGCPLSLQNTVTAGIVSCVDRKSSDLGIGGIRQEYLQTDCAVNEGNSGGPLVNLDGEVVGINILKVLNADGVSFAVPIDVAVKIMENLLERGRVIRPWLGLKMLDLNDMVISQLKERDSTFPNVIRGVLILMVTPGSPAEQAGFLPGDVVAEFDGKPISSIKEIIEKMGDKLGVPIKVTVNRANDKVADLTVVPEEASYGR
ncbi:putative protease Do-like 14 [Phalaenopsis equestris]|uniref:putative protease Do-like 14 n=1 Tax=Phalaenopsis equestris TaxID=78828 RepID=UPI0009E21A8B|nr:putative protease Do-like 14 [Phalaenopsis equestris]